MMSSFFDHGPQRPASRPFLLTAFFWRPPMAKLRAVRPGEPPRRQLTVSQAAKDGSRRDLLVALRIRIAQAVEDRNTPAPALAALSRRLLEIARELEAVGAEAGGDDVGKAAATPDEKWAASRDGDVGSGAVDPPE
jgi:hypothetical protein